MKHVLQVDENLLETVPHGDFSFPFQTHVDRLSYYDSFNVTCHWHRQPEFVVVTNGELIYNVDGKPYVVAEGNGIFVNSNRLHKVEAVNGQDSEYIVVIFDPVLIYGYEGSASERIYITPVLRGGASQLVLDRNCEWHNEIIDCLKAGHELNRNRKPCSELKITALLCRMWSVLYAGLASSSGLMQTSDSLQTKHVKDMLYYMHSCYADNLTLEDIAKACHLSSGTCCRIFKSVLGETLLTYLNSYRIKKSIPLLLEGTLSITQTAGAVGFASPGYYSETFRRILGVSPREYRKVAIREMKQDEL